MKASTNTFPAGWSGSLTTADLDTLTPASISAEGDPLVAEWTGSLDSETILEVSLSLHSDGDGDCYYASSSAAVRTAAETTVIMDETGIIERAANPRDALAIACCCPDPDQRDDDDPHAAAYRLLATTLGDLEKALER